MLSYQQAIGHTYHSYSVKHDVFGYHKVDYNREYVYDTEKSHSSAGDICMIVDKLQAHLFDL